MPPGAVIVNLLFIFAYSLFSVPQWFGRKNREQLEEKLLQHLLIFNHGEVGSKNLVALQLLLNNPPESPRKLPEYQQLLERRMRVFKEYNIPALRRIQSLLHELNRHGTHWRELKEKLTFLESASCHQPERLRQEINQLYTLVRRLKEEYFRKFSCDPQEVVLQIVELLPETLDVSVYKNYQGRVRAFIKREDLYFVLDNLLQNARRAVQDLNDGYVRVTLAKHPPGIIIKVRNNGPQIPAQKRAHLFSEETNEKKGRGMGLAHSRRILKKYQGHIDLEPDENGETVFKVELREIV